MIKKLLSIIVTFLCCAGVHAQYQSTLVGSTKTTVTLRTVGYGKNAKAAVADAEQKAVEMLMYAGVQETPYRFPMIAENKDAAMAKNKSFFKDFEDGSFKSYIESSMIVVPFGKDTTKKKCATVDVCVRAEQLRASLERAGIIRKFGF